MTRQTYIEVYPTRRWPGFLAIVWHGSWIERDVRQVFFGRDRAAVEADARQYAAAISGPGVDDPPAPRRGRPPKITATPERGRPGETTTPAESSLVD